MVLAGKIAVVTGASRGIGRATAARLARDGADLALLGRDRDELAGAAGEIEALGRRALAISADLLVRREVEHAFAQIAATLGPVDILVNNAGQGARQFAKDFCDSDLDVMDWMVNLNLLSTIYCSRQVVGSMRERRTGRIVNVSSEGAFIGSKANAGYAAAKAGVTGFTRSLAREMAPYGVNVNTVAPGYIRTQALQLGHQHIVDKAIAEIPQGHPGEPDDIAGVIAFFVGPDSRFVTGQCLLANGGRHMH